MVKVLALFDSIILKLHDGSAKTLSELPLHALFRPEQPPIPLLLKVGFISYFLYANLLYI